MQRLINFNVNVVHACLGLGVVISRVPNARTGGNVAQSLNGNAAPVFRRVRNYWPTATCASELVEQGLLSPSFGTYNVRTHFADMPLVGRNHLLFVEDGVSDGDVICAAHGDASLVMIERANVEVTGDPLLGRPVDCRVSPAITTEKENG